MKQSTVIFATLTFAFVVYITIRGQLPAYLALFSSSHDSNTVDTPERRASNPVGSSYFGGSVSTKDITDKFIDTYNKNSGKAPIPDNVKNLIGTLGMQF